MNAGVERADLWRRAWHAFVARPGRSLPAVVAAAVALAALLLLLGLGTALAPLLGRLPVAEATAFVGAGTSASDLDKLAASVAALDGVRHVRVLDRQTALEQLQQRLPQASAMNPNPLPHAVIAHFRLATPPAAVESTAAAMRQLPGVESVALDLTWYRQYLASGALFLAAAGTLLGALVVLALLVLLWAAAALTSIDARELALLDMLGASPSFVGGPHVLAGCLGMLAAACLSIGLYGLARWGWQLLLAAGEDLSPLLSLPWPELPALVTYLLVAVTLGAVVAAARVGQLRRRLRDITANPA
ncbi:MAG: permease-like cell division protein FtsX [Sutterellaceae bacterium]|nr:permease-like cell division protein FtsX [Burkholderiaceae bacterium]MCX7901036.1 permease-like cell division protein FtsX [Burkholderiaceae bacterium]MDW8430633.1 permease-like cell division protein FtsX [Sutterellaceae bacterium]